MNNFVAKVLSNPKLVAALKKNEAFNKELKPCVHITKEKVGPEAKFTRKPDAVGATSESGTHYDGELNSMARTLEKDYFVIDNVISKVTITFEDNSNANANQQNVNNLQQLGDPVETKIVT